jgi:hypothetical protein
LFFSGGLRKHRQSVFARGIARRPEIAMRTALGADRWRLLRQLLTENILLGLVGGACGVVFAALTMHISEISMPDRVPRLLAGWSTSLKQARARWSARAVLASSETCWL